MGMEALGQSLIVLACIQAVGASERVFELLERPTQMALCRGGRKPAGAPEGGHLQLLNV